MILFAWSMKRMFCPVAIKLLLLIGGVFLGSAHADETDFRVEKITAGFVFNFARLATWRDLPGQKILRLCVLTDPEFLDVFRQFSGKKVGGRILEVREFAEDQYQQCQILFIDKKKKHHYSCQSMKEAKNLLTISNVPGFAHNCGIIGLFEENNQLRFEINIDSINQSKVRLSAYLYKLARILREKHGQQLREKNFAESAF